MSKVNSFLSERFKAATKSLSKMTSLAEMSSKGDLSSFSGVFRVTPLSTKEQEYIAYILREFGEDSQDIQMDLQSLIAITSEVKAIQNQAAMLHGERIKKAGEILKGYKDGAFSAWLIATYGNRQTPYNFLQYFEFYNSISHLLHDKLDAMPRQAVYSLASRNGPMEKKEEIIQNYHGQPKQELLVLIRKTFPLEKTDKRASDHALHIVASLLKAKEFLQDPDFTPSVEQKQKIQKHLQSLQTLLSRK